MKMTSPMRRNFDYTRTNSICPTPDALLLDYVKKNQIENIKTLVTENPHLLSYIYDHPHNKPILLIACRESEVQPETIQVLLDLGADLNTINDEPKAVHLAAESTRSEILKVIIQNLPPGEINEIAEGNNALHYLIKCGNDSSEIEFPKCAEILIKGGIDVNQPDGNGHSAILLAAKKGNAELVKVILENSIAHVDLDSHKLRGKTARNLILDKKLYNQLLPERKKVDDIDPINKLFDFIKQSKEQEFINFYNRQNNNLLDVDDSESTILQSSCERGLAKIVQHLIDKGANVNLTTQKNRKAPILLAAETGNYKIFQILLNHQQISIPKQLIGYLIKNIDNEKILLIDHEKCYNLLLEKLQSNQSLININDEDDSKNTPLHYAIRYGGSEKTIQLLNLGASLACKNDFGVMPIEDIEPELLKKHLDNCIKFDLKNKNFDKQDFEITFDYHTLVPPPKGRYKTPDPENCTSSLVAEDLVAETEVISYMSRAPEFRDLLKHPIIVAFLFMKWYKICWLFYTNLIFYIIFVLSLIVYVFSYYGNFNDEIQSSLCKILGNMSWISLSIAFVILILREIFQIAVSPRKYFRNFENFIEIILIIITAMILFIDSPTDDTRKQLSAIAILLAAFELVLMVGQHPKLSTNVVMLRTVSFNFFKFLLWYSLLILAFALSFYILFTQPQSHQLKQNETKEAEEEDDSFKNPGKSIFKTVVMLTGEFDAGSINFNTYPIISKLIFSLFIFMIVIILLNLLNGLAVSDTQMIKDDAELVGHIVRAQHIYYVETMLLGNILPTNIMKILDNLCCCLPINIDLTYAVAKPLAKRVCLFPHLFHYEVTILPNNQGQISMEHYTNRRKKNQQSCWSCSNMFLDKETIRRTNSIIQEKRDEQLKIATEIEKDAIIKKLEESIEIARREQIDIKKKLDSIITLLSTHNNNNNT